MAIQLVNEIFIISDGWININWYDIQKIYHHKLEVYACSCNMKTAAVPHMSATPVGSRVVNGVRSLYKALCIIAVTVSHHHEQNLFHFDKCIQYITVSPLLFMMVVSWSSHLI